MSADHPRRGSSRQRPNSPYDFMSFLYRQFDRIPPPGASSSPSGMPPEPARLPAQESFGYRSLPAPLFSPLGQDHQPHNHSLEGPALAPLSTQSSSPTLQQPLPPLRSLNRGISNPITGAPSHLYQQYQPPQAPPPPLTTFPRPTPSQASDGNLPFGYRFNRRRPSNLTTVISSLDEIGHSLEDANSHLRALLDMPSQNELLNQLPGSLTSSFPHMMSARPGGSTGSRRESSRTEENGRLSKRRKLDSDKANAPPYKGFRYGRYGQVEPGQLKLEIVSCDGGLYSDGTSYAAENILKSDNSVYCTKGNRCNIVLQHQGCTTFSLKELIIKAPGRNYSSPVREGMVFLSMSKDELLQTEQYQSNVCPGSTSLLHHVDGLRQRPTHRSRSGHPAWPQTGDENEYVDDSNEAPFEEIYNLALNSSDHTPSAAPVDPETVRNPPSFYVMTECSDDEDDEAAGRGGRDRDARGAAGWRGNTARWSPTPLRNRTRQRLPAYGDDSPMGAHLITWDMDHNYEVEDDDDYTELYDLGDATVSSPDSPPGEGEARSMARSRTERDRTRDRNRDRSFNRGEGREPREGSSAFSQGPSLFEGRSTEQDTNAPQATVPHAEFHIEKNKNKCTIRFNPPVTARYILLKMWNPRQDMAGNIDIQGVVAKGFAGPRYFPSLELR